MANRVFEKTAFADEAKEFAENLAGALSTGASIHKGSVAVRNDGISRRYDYQRSGPAGVLHFEVKIAQML